MAEPIDRDSRECPVEGLGPVRLQRAAREEEFVYNMATLILLDVRGWNEVFTFSSSV
jgi:hypothetical protein